MSQICPKKNKRFIGMVVAGGLESAGGIGRVIGYTLDVWKTDYPDMDVKLYDPRGAGSILFFPMHLFLSLLEIWRDARAGRLDLLHVNLASYGSTLRKVLIVALASALRVPVVLHLHGALFHVFYAKLPLPLKWIVRRMFAKAQRVIVLGKGWRDFLVKEVGVAPQRIAVIPNGVPRPALAEREGEVQDECRLLFLGRLGARKGVPDLLSALAQDEVRTLPWRAVLAGDGDVTFYKEEAVRLGIAHKTVFAGWVNTQETQRLLRTSDILVLPSHAEGLPMSVVEGLAFGLAVVATPVGAVPEWLEDGKQALIVPVGDVRALAQALVRVINDAGLRRSLGASGRELFCQQFDVRMTAAQIADVYKNVRIANDAGTCAGGFV